jgi:hypothetical protein
MVIADYHVAVRFTREMFSYPSVASPTRPVS